MEPVGLPVSSNDRCSELTRLAGIDPIGTADCVDGFLLVEWPRPWPKKTNDVGELAEVVAMLTELQQRGRTYRLQLVLGSDTAPGQTTHHVMLYARGRGGFSGFALMEQKAETADVASACRDLVERAHGEPDWAISQDHPMDVLICTHGTRDVCCGSRGSALYRDSGSLHNGSIRLWQTSHLGGHRFAPTALILPDGQWWAYLDVTTLQAIVQRDPDVEQLRPFYRGSSAFASKAVQAVEREAFAMCGWQWLETVRDASLARSDGGRERVLLTYQSSDEAHRSVCATVVQGDEIYVPACRGGSGDGTTDRPPVVVDFAAL
jgi:hypothetical protein